MHLGLEHELQREVPHPQHYEWSTFNRPLILKAADEFGAMFQEPGHQNAVWYLDLNEMHYRPLKASDVPVDRLEHARPYSLPEKKFPNGIEAAMSIREQHLIEQMKPLEFLNNTMSKEILAGMQEELDLVRAYLHETEPKERGRLIRDLQEIYREMREDVLGTNIA